MDYRPPFGYHYKEKNLFMAYYRPIVEAIENDDRLGFDQLKEELMELDYGLEKFLYIMKHIDSSYRAKVKGWNDE